MYEPHWLAHAKPFSFGLCAAGGFVFFNAGEAFVWTIARVKNDGTGLNENLLTLQSNGRLVGADANFLYTFEQGKAEEEPCIGRCKHDGTAYEPEWLKLPRLIKEGALEIRGFAVTATHLYFGTSGAGTIARATITGESLELEWLAQGTENIATDGVHLFWTNATQWVARATVAGTEVQPEWLKLVKRGFLIVASATELWIGEFAEGEGERIGHAHIDGTAYEGNWFTFGESGIEGFTFDAGHFYIGGEEFIARMTIEEAGGEKGEEEEEKEKPGSTTLIRSGVVGRRR